MCLCYLANSGVISSSPVLAGHTVKQSDFQDKYLKKLFNTPQVICVFLQDRVSGSLGFLTSKID